MSRSFIRDYDLEVQRGRIPGVALIAFSNLTDKVGTIGQLMHFWGLDQEYTYLTSETTLYASSTNAADTAVQLFVPGLDGDYNPVLRTVTLNGQTQVAISGGLLRNTVFLVTPGTTTVPLGDVYLAEQGATTAGVPDDITTIKNFMKFPNNNGQSGTITVPAGKTFHSHDFVQRTGKGEAIKLMLRVTGFNSYPSILAQSKIFEDQSQSIATRIPVPEKSDIDWQIVPDVAAVTATSLVDFYQVNN